MFLVYNSDSLTIGGKKTLNKLWLCSDKQTSVFFWLLTSMFLIAVPSHNFGPNVFLLSTEPVCLPRRGLRCRAGSSRALQGQRQHDPRSPHCSGGRRRDFGWLLLQWHLTQVRGTPRPRRQQHPEIQRWPHSVCPRPEPTGRAGWRRLHDSYARQTQTRYQQDAQKWLPCDIYFHQHKQSLEGKLPNHLPV